MGSAEFKSALVRVVFPKSQLCFKPLCDYTAVIKRKYTTYITSALFGPITLTVCRLSRVITHTSHGKTDPYRVTTTEPILKSKPCTA